MTVNFNNPFGLPAYWENNPEVVQKLDEAKGSSSTYTGVPCACPLKIKLASEREWWSLPIEPVITINGKNSIVKRSVLKVPGSDGQRRGTVKELWSQDDYSITIAGVFIADKSDTLPAKAMARLLSYCEARESIMVQSPLFTIFGIDRIALESYQFPFTKGMENQLFTLSAVSDDFDKDKLLIQE